MLLYDHTQVDVKAEQVANQSDRKAAQEAHDEDDSKERRV